MADKNSFDKFFLNLPPYNKESDFELFWNKSIKELEKIPINPTTQRVESNESKKFEFFNITFKSAGKTQIHGSLFFPKKSDKARLIIFIPDYNQPSFIPYDLLTGDCAYFFLTLRGQDLTKKVNRKDEKTTPGYMTENIIDKEFYYVKNIYLDSLRTIDMFRLIKKIDCKSIGIMGKGLGASAALFTASYSDRIAALVLDTPSFCYLETCQNVSSSDATKEINTFLNKHRSRKKTVKKNLTYFDSINFSDKIKCPTLATVGLKDTISPPECVFALFNHLQCEKTIEVYPEDDNKAGGKEQLKKSIRWLKRRCK